MDLVKESLMKAGIATMLILLIGFLVGLQVDDMRTGYIQDQLEESSLRTQTFIVTESYLSDSSKNYCKVVSGQIPDIAEQNAQIGQDLQSLSGKSVSNNYKYKNLKKEYYVNQLRLYNTLESYKNRCNENITSIFYFFDNSVQSKRQGAVLTRYRQEIDNQTYVFSYNLATEDSRALNILIEDFEITDGPSIVVNGNKTFKRYVPLAELEEVIQ